MFPTNKITAVHRGQVKSQAIKASFAPAQSMSSNTSVSSHISSQYNFYMSGLIPATPDQTDASTLAYFYRDMYMFDNIAGSCVDIQSVFPFSGWELRGLDEKHIAIFDKALARLNLRELIPQISVSYLTDGFYAGSFVYDAEDKNFMDVLTYDALTCSVSPSPFNNIDPAVRVNASGAIATFLSSGEGYAKQYMNSIPRSMVDVLKSGSFVLDPVSSMFVGRRGLTDRPYMSYLHRLLPMYLVEKTMYRGTLVEATRRQRAMSQIAMGDDTWTPTAGELAEMVQVFQQAEQDPLGGWVGTRSGVQVSDLRPGGDFWKFTDMADVMVGYKLRALGISEALLSGDACLVGETLVRTNNGCSTISSLCPIDTEPASLPVGEWFPLNLDLPNRVSDCAKTKAWSYQGKRDVFTITTETGEKITGTENHPFWVMGEDGVCSWKRLDQLKVGDLVAVED